MSRMRRIRCLAVGLLAGVLLAACGDDAVAPEDVEASGVWMMSLMRAPSEFEFTLTEDASGRITGTWSYPMQFANHSVRGQRNGLTVMLTADSPNMYPTSLELRFIRPTVMEGKFYFGGAVQEVTLGRR